MKHFSSLKKVLLICLLPAAGTATAQVLNGDFNHLLEFRQSESNASFGTRGATINFYALKANLNNNGGNPQYITPFPTLCHNYTSSSNPEVAKAILTSTFTNEDVFNGFKLNLSVRRYRKNSNSANTCTYTTASTADQLVLEQAYFVNDPRDYEKTPGNFSNITFTTGSTFTRYRSYWRYSAGAGINGALQFGSIATGGSKTHTNNNYGTPDNNATYASYGYGNAVSVTQGFPQTANFQNATDVSYSFTLTEPAFVTISTDDPITNFDSYLTLVRRNNNGGFLNYDIVQSNDNGGSNNRAKIATQLCAGDYVVVVEGKDGSGATNGNFKLTINSVANSAGSIENGHTIPNPQELIPDYITSLTAPNTPAILSWQRSTTGTDPWTTISNSDTIAYRLPPTTASAYYRRNASFSCGSFGSFNLQTNPAFIRVVSPNGSIEGFVKSLNGTGVSGIAVTATRQTPVEGSPNGFIYRDTTDNDGYFKFDRMYYGRRDTVAEATFLVQAYKLNHVFNNEKIVPRKLTDLSPTVSGISGVTITDSTVYSITGRTFQKCVGCLNGSNDVTTIEGALDSVEIFRNNSFITKTGYLSSLDSFGRYAVTVTDPGNYLIAPTFKNHKFNPVSQNVRVDDNVANVNFEDTTTYAISGRLTAGCNDYIGTAVIEFYDLLPRLPNGTERPSQFRKRVTTNAGSGFYSIRLPARKYAAKVISFSPAENADVTSLNLKEFFDVRVPLDSLTRDITLGDTTLNFVYVRPPSIEIAGLENVCTTPEPFSIIEQNEVKQFTVQAFQGPKTKNCPALGDTFIINTNIQKDDVAEIIKAKATNGSANVSLKGGTPKISGDHFKILNIVYNDGFGRTEQLNRNVVVTGLKSDPGTFTTVSPQVPIMVLHDPPGDQSFSFWETTKSVETATRFYTAMGGTATAWAEVKLGTKISTGVAVSTETEVWGSVKGSVTVAGRVNKSKEAILSTSTTEYFSTSEDVENIGDGGDVFIGSAINLLYAPTTDISFDAANCKIVVSKKLMVAPNGFGTQFIYSETHIRNDVLVTLRRARDEAVTDAAKNDIQNQINVWEQVLANNNENKKKAVFDHNKSIDGGAGKYTSSTTTTSTRSNTIEFDLEVSAEIAAELGLEVAGSGVSGGVSVGFKMETGNSETNTVMNATTIGFEIADEQSSPEKFSINIKKDPVYNSPVFEVVAATTSCPHEPGTQPRDAMTLTVPQPVKTNIAPDGEAEFILKLGNESPSGETRTYKLSFVQASNPNGAVVTIGGSSAIIPNPYELDYGQEINVVVKVKRGLSSVYTYEGLEFKLTDECESGMEKRVRISAFFESTCSPVQLVLPENGWVSNVSDNNIIPIHFKGYTVAGTTSVSLEYQKSTGGGWLTGFTRPAAQLDNSANGMVVNWNVSGLTDGAYNLRMKLNCPSGIVYSLRSSGIIDRKAPFVIAQPEPTDDEFVRGDKISLEYNEPLDCSGVTPSDVTITRLSNGQTIGANVGCFQNRIVVVPLADISAFTGDSIKVSVNNISDAYGNGKTEADTWGFLVGSSIPATGPKALSVTPTGGTGGGIAGKAVLAGPTTSVQEDAGLPIKFVFELGANTPNDMLINYSISGNAVFQKDYLVDYSQTQNLATVFNGASGSLTLKKGSKKIELVVYPLMNQQFEPDKTITITLLDGGDYLLGANITASGIILNDDTPTVYTFTGNGNYNEPANWDNNLVPPSQILIGDEVIIDPPNGSECILNVPVTVMPGAKFEVKPGKVLRINNALNIKKKL